MPIRWNPEFHPNILKMFSYNRNPGDGLQPLSMARGYILEDPTNIGPGSAGGSNAQRGVRFLYNPSVLNVAHQLSENQPAPAEFQSKDNLGTALGANGNMLSFALLFDRTYEVWDSGYANTLAGKQGCYADIRALYDLTGLIQWGEFNANVGQFVEPIQYMTLTMAYFYFGTQGRSLSFYGFINSLNIEYSHWTKDMVPVRATANISVQIVPMNNASDTASGLVSPGNVSKGRLPGQTMEDYKLQRVGQ